MNYLGLIAFATSVAVVRALIRVRPHVLADVADGLVQFPALPTLEASLAEVCLHVLLQ